MKQIHSFFILAVVALCAGGCTETQIDPDASDFFPVSDGTRWSYKRWISNDADNPLEIPLDTLSLHVQGDTVIDGHSYKKILHGGGGIEKVVRKEGQKYYGRDHELYGGFSHEYVFLDVSKNQGESWEYYKYDSLFKTEYIILTRDGTHDILGKTYHDVIEVLVNYYRQGDTGEYELWVHALHYYARGEGEIYHFYPYPVSFVYGDVSAFKLN